MTEIPLKKGDGEIMYVQLRELLADCVLHCEEECEGVTCDRQGGIYPRGFAYAEQPGRILVVSHNPGTIKPDDEEARRYVRSYDRVTLTIQKNIEALVSAPDRFHRNLQMLLWEALDCSPEHLLEKVSFTNLVKCQATRIGSRIPPGTIERCKRKYLDREVDILQPILIIANGSVAKEYLEASVKVCPTIHIPHTSWRQAWDSPGCWSLRPRRPPWPISLFYPSPRKKAMRRIRKIAAQNGLLDRAEGDEGPRSSSDRPQ